MSGFVDYVKSVLAEADGNKFTSSALSSFLSSLRHDDSQCLSEDDLRLWVAEMILAGFKKTTRKRYFGKVRNIYNEWSSEGTANPFAKVGDAIVSDFEGCPGQAEANLLMVQPLLSKTKDSVGWEYLNAFFYLLYNVESSLVDVINLKFGDPVPDLPQIEDIIAAMKDTRQLKFVFGLNRGAKREPQLQRELNYGLETTLQKAGMRFIGNFSRNSITAIWVAAALRCHIPLNELRSMLTDIPDEYAFLSLMRPEEISEERKRDILKTVAFAINDNTPRWFVMKLRKGVDLGKVRENTDEVLPGCLDTMELFYPTRTTYRDRRGKTIKEETPYIPDLLFFKTQYSKIRGIFAKIGDIAYCLKENRLPDSRYSVIGQEEMSNFQRCVGQFTDDIRINLVDANRGLGKGRKVRITGGIMKGYKGKIEDVHDDKGTRIFFLNVSNEQALKWKAEVDEALIEPLDE